MMNTISEIHTVAIELIEPNPYQFRIVLDEHNFRLLIDSIKINGLLQALLVRPHPQKTGQYQLVFGSRRLEACRALGWKEVPVIIRKLSDQQVVEITMEENMKREDLNPYEEAEAYRVFIMLLGYTEDAVAKRFGKSRSYIANRLRLLSMDPYLTKCVLSKTLQPWQALMIEKAPVIKNYLADFVIDWGLTFDELREAIRRLNSGEEDIRIKRSVDPKSLQVLEPEYYDCDSTYLEELMIKGGLPFTVSVWIDGVVRLGHLAVLVAEKLEWNKLEVEIVFPASWLKNDTAPIIQFSDPGSYENAIFPSRTDEQKRASVKLCQFLGDQKEYPLLLVDYMRSDQNDLMNIPPAKPVQKKPLKRAILNSIR